MRMNLILPVDNIYMIRRKDLIDPHFFLYEWIDSAITMNGVLWTPNEMEAREFYSEESVETFFHEKLHNRPCEIIMVK